MENTKLLIVDDEEDLLQLLIKRLRRKGYIVDGVSTAEEALKLLNKDHYDIGVFDIRLPGIDGIELLKQAKVIFPELAVLMLTGHGTIETAIEAIKEGAFDYLAKPYNLAELELTIQKAMENKQLKEKNDIMRKIIKKHDKFEIIGNSPAINRVIELTKRVADSDVPVLIEGESGTGKELFAKALHYWSVRSDEPFIAINSGALPEQLIESELFGHVKGAFTGANQNKKGLVEAASCGTLFLDEIGEMPLSVQIKLLRFLETGEYRRVGDVKERKVNVRVVAATNRDMEKEIDIGNFREDLYYRLNVVKLSIPPLRRRTEDISELITFFIQKSRTPHKQLSSEAMKALLDYSYPGNIRELHHIIERGLLLSESHIIKEDVLLLPIQIHKKDSELDEQWSLEKVEKEHIEKILKKLEWNKTKAAEILGVSVRNLYRKIDLYQLTPEE